MYSRKIFRFNCKCRNCGSRFDIISHNHYDENDHICMGKHISFDLRFLYGGIKIATNSDENRHYCKDRNKTGGIIYELLGYEPIEDENELEKYREKLKTQEEIFEYY